MLMCGSFTRFGTRPVFPFVREGFQARSRRFHPEDPSRGYGSESYPYTSRNRIPEESGGRHQQDVFRQARRQSDLESDRCRSDGLPAAGCIFHRCQLRAFRHGTHTPGDASDGGSGRHQRKWDACGRGLHNEQVSDVLASVLPSGDPECGSDFIENPAPCQRAVSESL